MSEIGGLTDETHFCEGDPDLREMLAWSQGRLDELTTELHAATAPEELCQAAVELATRLVDDYEYRAGFADVLGEPDLTRLSSVLECARIVDSTLPDGAFAEAMQLPRGAAHTYLYEVNDERADLEAGLQHWSAAVPRIADPTERARRQWGLARLFLSRYAAGSPTPYDDLTRAVHLLGVVLGCPDVAHLHAESTSWRALALFELCELTEGADPELAALTAMALTALGDARSLLVPEDSGDFGDLDEAIDARRERAELAMMSGGLLYRRDALDLPPADGSDLDLAIDLLLSASSTDAFNGEGMLCLARSLIGRFDRQERDADRDAAIRWFDQAAGQGDLSAEDRAECRERRGALLLRRFDVEQRAPDLEAAIRDLTAARDALEPGADTRFLAVLALVEALAHRAGSAPAAQDVIEQVRCVRELLEDIPDEHPDRVYMLIKMFLAFAPQIVGRQQWRPEFDDLLPGLNTAAASPTARDGELRMILTLVLGWLYALRFLGLMLDGGSDLSDAAAAVGWLEECLDRPETDEDLKPNLHGLLGMVLWMRALIAQGWSPDVGLSSGSQQFSSPAHLADPDLTRSLEHLELFRAADPSGPVPLPLALLRAFRALASGVETIDDARLDDLARDLADAKRSEAMGFFPLVAALRGRLLVESGRRAGRLLDADQAIAILRAALDELLPGNPIRGIAKHFLGNALCLRGELLRSAEEFLEAVEVLCDAVDLFEAQGQDSSSPREDLAAAVAATGSFGPAPLLERARGILGPTQGRKSSSTPGVYVSTPQTAARIAELAAAHHERGELRRAIEVGNRALHEYALTVLLSEGPEAGLAVARAGNRHAERVVRWCLSVGDPAAAIAALEAGRALVLHAWTLSTGLPDVLRRNGYLELASKWQTEGAGAQTRAEAVAALYGSPAGMRLLAPMFAEQIGPVIWAAELDALVYLVAGDNGSGAALLVRENGDVEHLPLPGLRSGDDGAVSRCRAAHRTAFLDRSLADVAPLAPDAAIQRWQASLEKLSDWAYGAVVGPLLAHARGWGRRRLPRLALVPTGPLAAVAWHAARHRVDGLTRYACQDAVFSYAASARQLADSTHRERLPLQSSPMFVANPSGRQTWASLSAVGARSAFYPGAAYLGYPTSVPGRRPGTVAEVLAHLPSAERDGASMVQLSSHAKVHDSSTQSYFELARGERLTVEQVLRHSRERRPEAPGGLVICDSCMTDLTEDDHDEVLTLGTAFLAAGAVTVIGARWPIDDRTAAVMTFVLHHQLALGLAPADALRQTQLWMLDLDRPIPQHMPPALAAQARRRDLAGLTAWAGLTHQGQ